jgi:foldase protein PrsA
MKSWFGWVGIGVGIAVAAGAVGVVKLRNQRPIVIVNGEKITRARFLNELERNYGGAVLRQMLQEKLVLQQARKKGVMPTPQEVQAEIAEMREEEPDLDRQLRIRGKAVDDLSHDVEGRLAVAHLIASEVKLPDSEIQKLWATYQKRFNKPDGRKVEIVVAKTKEIGAKARRLLADGIPAEFASQNPGMALPGGRSQMILYRGQGPKEIEQPAFALRPGQVSEVVRLGNAFAVIKVTEVIPARQKRFEDVKQRLMIAAKLRKGKSEPELLQSLQQAAQIQFKSDRYKGLADASLASADPRGARVAQGVTK